MNPHAMFTSGYVDNPYISEVTGTADTSTWTLENCETEMTSFA